MKIQQEKQQQSSISDLNESVESFQEKNSNHSNNIEEEIVKESTIDHTSKNKKVKFIEDLSQKEYQNKKLPNNIQQNFEQKIREKQYSYISKIKYYSPLNQGEIDKIQLNERLDFLQDKLNEAEKHILQLTIENKKISASNIIQNNNYNQAESQVQNQIKKLQEQNQQQFHKIYYLNSEIKANQQCFTQSMLQNYRYKNTQQQLPKSINFFEYSTSLINCHFGSITDLIFFQHPMNQQIVLVSSGNDCHIKLWDIITQQELHSFKMEYIPDICSIASGSSDGYLNIQDITFKQEKQQFRLDKTNNSINCLKFCDSYKHLLIGKQKYIFAYDISSNKIQKKVEFINDTSILSIDINVNQNLISANVESELKIWDFPSCKEISIEKINKITDNSKLCKILFLNPYNLLCVIRKDQLIQCFDLKSGNAVRNFQDFDNFQLVNAKYLQNIDSLLTCGLNGNLNLWNVGQQTLMQRNIQQNVINQSSFSKLSGAICYNEPCKFFAAGTLDKQIDFYLFQK